MSDSQTLVREINRWVSNVTEGNIEKMIEDGTNGNNLYLSLLIILVSQYPIKFSREQRKGVANADSERALLQRLMAT